MFLRDSKEVRPVELYLGKGLRLNHGSDGKICGVYLANLTLELNITLKAQSTSGSHRRDY